MASSFLRVLDHAQRGTAVGRTPLDKRSARSRDLYLKTHNTHNRKTSMAPAGFEPTVLAGLRLRLILHEQLPHHRSPPTSAAQNRCCQPRGNAGPRGWQRLQRHDLDSSAAEIVAYSRGNTSIWTNAPLAALLETARGKGAATGTVQSILRCV